MINVAIEAAKEAGKILMNNLGKLSVSQIANKQQFDFVTEVDKESEKQIIEIIKSTYPSHKIFAEETQKDDIGGYRWIIDPLDGTTNYIHSYPIFSVSIGLELDGEIILGVVFDPNKDEMFVAEKGKGAYLNGLRIYVSKVDDPAKALFTTGFPFRSKEYIDDYMSSFKELFYLISGVRRCGSAALDLSYLAAGRCDGFWEIGLSPWDIAAGYILIKEAGGKITDFSGGHFPLETGNVIATNGIFHNDIVKSVHKIFKGKINK
jgi:myo-inositol-1(or 4)-monophosphatase